MPSTMIHLLFAHKLEPDAVGHFYLGNFAPDAIDSRAGDTRAAKDENHFRTAHDRWNALERFARGADMSDPFQRGYIMHLFLDAHWDKDFFAEYARTHTGADWFAGYRLEIRRAGAWLFHNAPWSAGIWKKILAASTDFHNPLGGPTDDEILAYTCWVFMFLNGMTPELGDVLTPGFLESYTDDIARKYHEWVSLNNF